MPGWSDAQLASRQAAMEMKSVAESDEGDDVNACTDMRLQLVVLGRHRQPREEVAGKVSESLRLRQVS